MTPTLSTPRSLTLYPEEVRALLNTKPGVWPAEPIEAGEPYLGVLWRAMKIQPPQRFASGDSAVLVNSSKTLWAFSNLSHPGIHAQAWPPDPLPGIRCPLGKPGDALIGRRHVSSNDEFPLVIKSIDVRLATSADFENSHNPHVAAEHFYAWVIGVMRTEGNS